MIATFCHLCNCSFVSQIFPKSLTSDSWAALRKLWVVLSQNWAIFSAFNVTRTKDPPMLIAERPDLVHRVAPKRRRLCLAYSVWDFAPSVTGCNACPGGNLKGILLPFLVRESETKTSLGFIVPHCKSIPSTLMKIQREVKLKISAIVTHH